MKEADLRITSDQECKKHWPKEFVNSMFCADGDGKDSCQVCSLHVVIETQLKTIIEKSIIGCEKQMHFTQHSTAQAEISRLVMPDVQEKLNYRKMTRNSLMTTKIPGGRLFLAFTLN